MRALVIAFLFPAALFAQEFRGTFSGTVTAAQGAAIPQVKVIATQTQTGARPSVYVRRPSLPVRRRALEVLGGAPRVPSGP